MKSVFSKFFRIAILLAVLYPVAIFAQYPVKKINITGNETFSSGQIKNQMQLKERGTLKRLFFWRDLLPFDETLLQNDIASIKDFYKKEGFLNVDVDAVTKIDNSVAIDIKVHENQPIIISNVIFNINPNSGKDSSTSLPQDIQKQLRLIKGERFTDNQYKKDLLLINSYYVNNGFPYVLVDPKLSVQDNFVQVVFSINTGQKSFFGEISVQNEQIPSYYIKKQISFSSGDNFSQNELGQSQQQVYELGVFQYVSVNALLDSTTNNQIPVSINVKESARFRTKTGIGYGKEDQVRLFAEVRKIGFLGSVRRITLNAKHSYLEPYNLNLKWVHPAFVWKRTSLTIEPFLRKEREPAYRIRRTGISSSVHKNVSSDIDIFMNYSLEQAKLYTNSLTKEELLANRDISLYNKSGITLGITRDTSVPMFTPNSGSYLSATYTISGLGFNSSFHYHRFLAEAHFFRKINESTVLALKTKWGVIETWQNSIAPIEERFFIGGSSSVRGWARSELGPKSSQGKPLGGNSYIENSIELRFPVWSRLSGVIFMDFGNVWTSSLYFDMNDLHYSPGVGIRLHTPIGPIRVDMASPIFDDKTTFEYHLSVGHAF